MREKIHFAAPPSRHVSRPAPAFGGDDYGRGPDWPNGQAKFKSGAVPRLVTRFQPLSRARFQNQFFN
jgi:hypothetical protein